MDEVTNEINGIKNDIGIADDNNESGK